MTTPKKLGRYVIGAAAFLVLSVACGGAESTPPDVQVELDSQNPLALHVTVRSRANERITLAKYRLPWGNTYSMILVAATPQGHMIDKSLPVDDPSPEHVSLEPNETLRGDINLANYFQGLDGALKKSEIHLFWAYKAPDELHIASWSGGWILIRQPH